MIYSTLLVAVSAIAGFASAQNATGGAFTSCCDVQPNSVKTDLRLSWCRAQQNSCPEVCPNGQTSANTCDPNTLTFNCKCLSGNTPNISDYAQTLPSLECDEWKAQCTASHPNDLSGQTFCQSFVCGMKNASLTVGGGGSSSSASASASTASGTARPSSTSSGAATSSSAAAAALSVARDYGTGAVALGMLALFGLGL